MDNKKYVTLNNDQIEKFNNYSCELGTLKTAFNVMIEYIENNDSNTSINSLCMLYIVYSYIENLKNKFTEFLNECGILL